MSRVHVIGGGLAGLSAAVTASGAGRPVTLYESTAAAGGRCRSYHDSELGIRVDNGNHLLLSGNRAAFAYIDAIGARDRLMGPGRPLFPFVDLRRGGRWTLRPGRGRVPWWLLFADRRVPRTSAIEHLALLSLGKTWDDTAIADSIPHSRLYWYLVEPLAVAALNTRPHEALACLFGAVLRETLLKGGKACLPRVPKEGLSEALITPAVETLRARGADVRFNRRVTGLEIAGGRVTGLRFADGAVETVSDDQIVLAVPPWAAGELLPNLTVPDAFESILNIHFKLRAPVEGDIAEAGFVGVVRGTAEWIFIKEDNVSVTISAANSLIDRPAADLAVRVWRDIVQALELEPPVSDVLPPFRVIRERRATIVANVTQEERRPAARTDLANLVLAGDWTDTGLPGTMEGAIRSGVTAVNTLTGRADGASGWFRRRIRRHGGS